jgi:DNA-binding transcriptional LysR family regulator
MCVLSPYVPELDVLELLLAIDRTGSFARAGAERGISQSAVSLRMKSVEARMGVRLIERGPMGSRLTVAGALVADWAREVLIAADKLDAGISALREQRDSHLRLAASLTVAEHLLPTWLSQLQVVRRATAVSLTAVNSAAVAELVLTGQVELGFVEGPRVPPGLTSRRVGVDELVLVCAPGSSLARRARRPLSVAEVAALALVERETGSGTRAAFDAALAGAARHRASPVLEVSSTSGLHAAVLAGVGPAVMSSLTVADDIAAGRLVALTVDGLTLRRQLRVIWRRGATIRGAGRELLAIAGRVCPAGSPEAPAC